LDAIGKSVRQVEHEFHGVVARALPDQIGRDQLGIRVQGNKGPLIPNARARRKGLKMEYLDDALRQAVETQHGGTATLAQSVPVKETHAGTVVWEGIVHVFDLKGHPTASRAYAWSSPIEGSDKRRYFAVLHQGPVKSPVDAVRAAIITEHRRQ